MSDRSYQRLEPGADRAWLRPAMRSDGLTSEVVAYLKRYIVERGLKPGDRLPGEAETAKAVGVSRPVVREASRTLLALGLVDVAPGRPPRVGQLRGGVLHDLFEHALITGQADPRHVLEVRRGLEIGMAALAAARRTQKTVERLAKLGEDMARHLREPEAFVALDLEFHRTIAEATANPLFVTLIDGCRAAFEASMDAGLRHRFGEAELQRVQDLHTQIIESIKQGNAEAAAAAMTSHFDDALAALYRGAKSRNQPPKPKD